jgi:5-methylcytosine-specific restriction endonuclease McrA
MKRVISAAFRAARHEMRSRLIQCHDCTDYATELHHIVAVEDGGTDEISNLMPLCRDCHKEYTSGQTIERNQMWVELKADDGDVTAQIKGGPVESLG